MEVKLIAYTPNPVDVCEHAAAFCYDSEPTADGRIVKSCIESGHESVSEHASFTFDVTGISRACLAQLTRHRIGTAFTVRSQRYCDESEFPFVTPPTVRHSRDRANEYACIMGEIRRAYQKLICLGVPKEDARFVLPNACTTSLALSFNARELIHFCNLRLCTRAQWEIRDLAAAIVREVVAVAPALKSYLVPNCERLGYCPEKRGGCGNRPTFAEMLHASEVGGYFSAMTELNKRGSNDTNNGKDVE